MTNNTKHLAHCGCGSCAVIPQRKPLTRFYCHCKICQEVYGAPYSDFLVYKASSVKTVSDATLKFAKYRLPPALNRGKCTTCGDPVVAYLRAVPFLKLAFVPTNNMIDKTIIPAAEGHLFYHRHTTLINDDLPKHQGYWFSEIAITKAIMKSLLAK